MSWHVKPKKKTGHTAYSILMKNPKTINAQRTTVESASGANLWELWLQGHPANHKVQEIFDTLPFPHCLFFNFFSLHDAFRVQASSCGGKHAS